ncbi:Pol poly [Labeo rohita]|uniref:Pol poly n=1 Tax=Labeo rohita TaxID=84645 RepID=A0A498NNE4_LABRO|nr:Pol poly [Labeo rohita]
MIKVFDRSVFGQEASRLLSSLRQGKRSAADYAIEFRTLAATCEWNEPALTARFLEGLMEEVREEILSRDVPSSLDQMVELAIRLDKRFEWRRRARVPARTDTETTIINRKRRDGGGSGGGKEDGKGAGRGMEFSGNSALVDNANTLGDAGRAQESSRTAKNLNIASLVFGLIGLIMLIVMLVIQNSKM